MLLGLERNLLRELIERCRFSDKINLNYFDNRAQVINKLIALLYTVQDQAALTIVLDILKCKYTYLDIDAINSSISKVTRTEYENILSNMNKLLQEQDELIKKLHSHFNFDFEQQDKK